MELATASQSNGGQGAEDGQQFFVTYQRVQGKRIILFLSRIDRKKGIELLIDAFAMVRNQQKDVALVIAGEGEEAYVGELPERAARVRIRIPPRGLGLGKVLVTWACSPPCPGLVWMYSRICSYAS